MDYKDALPNLARVNLGEQVYQILRDHIFDYRYDVGERLDLNAIGYQLGISRTPLKTAVDRLAAEGLLKIVPRRGTYIVAPSLETIDNAYAVREVLECYAVGQCTERITEEQLERLADLVAEMNRITQLPDDTLIYPRYAELDYGFHQVFVDAANNDVLLELWQRTLDHTRRARVRYRRRDKSILRPNTRMHQTILDGLRARDAERAVALMREHLREARAHLKEDFQRLGDSPVTTSTP